MKLAYYIMQTAETRTNNGSLHWRHNDHDDVSNHQPHGCLLNRLFGRRSKKTSQLRVTGLCAGNSPRPVNSPHKGSVTRKCFHLMTSSCVRLFSDNSYDISVKVWDSQRLKLVRHFKIYENWSLQRNFPEKLVSIWQKIFPRELFKFKECLHHSESASVHTVTSRHIFFNTVFVYHIILHTAKSPYFK